MKWNQHFATGIQNIDDQHRKMVEIITMYETMSKRNATWHEFRPLVTHTREFMEFHFSVEESLMRLLPYPDFEAHRAEHQDELRRIADIERGMLGEHGRESLAAQMRSCLLVHIVDADSRFAKFALGLYAWRQPGKGKDGTNSAAARYERYE